MERSLLIAILVVVVLIFLLRLYNILSNKKVSNKNMNKLTKDLKDISNIEEETKVVESLNNQMFELAKEVEVLSKEYKSGTKMAQARNKAMSKKLDKIERVLFEDNPDNDKIVGVQNLRKEILNIINETVYCEEGLNKVRERNKAMEERELFEKMAHEDMQKLSKEIKKMDRELQHKCGSNPF